MTEQLRTLLTESKRWIQGHLHLVGFADGDKGQELINQLDAAVRGAQKNEFIQCPSCGWHPVRKHEPAHTGGLVIKPFQCVVCGRGANEAGVLHRVSRKGDTKPVIWICTEHFNYEDWKFVEDNNERLTRRSAQAGEPWTVERLDEDLDLKFERGPVELRVSEYYERLRKLAFKINTTIKIATEKAKGSWIYEV